MKWAYLTLFTTLVLVIMIFVMLNALGRDIDEFKQRCERDGGRPVHLQDGYECLDKGVFR